MREPLTEKRLQGPGGVFLCPSSQLTGLAEVVGDDLIEVGFAGTEALLSRTGQLRVDPETDSSGARFVTRESVERCCISRHEKKPRKHSAPTGVPIDEVVRFTGYTSAELIDLVRAGVLEQFPGRRKT